MPGEVADRVHRDLRVVGAGLDAQVAVASGPGRGCRRGSAGGRCSAAGCRSARPNRSLPSASRNSDGPKPKVMRQPGGRQAERLAGVVGRRVVRPLDRADLAGRQPARHPAAAAVQAFSSATSSARGVGRDVERREVQPVLGGRDDAGLVLAVEGVATRPAAPRRTRRSRRAARRRRRTRRPARPRPRRRRAARGGETFRGRRRALRTSTAAVRLRQRLGRARSRRRRAA